MPTDVAAILLVPAEGNPHGLLAEGPCGARPPTGHVVTEPDGRVWIDVSATGIAPIGRKVQRALVLAWGGEPVVEGLDRATRAVGDTPRKQYGQHYVFRTLLERIRWVDQIGTILIFDPQGRGIDPAGKEDSDG